MKWDTRTHFTFACLFHLLAPNTYLWLDQPQRARLTSPQPINPLIKKDTKSTPQKQTPPTQSITF